MKVIKINNMFSKFTEQWTPKIIGEINDTQVKIAKFTGEFVWHSHENEDELFMVIKGSLLIRLRDQELHVNEGEFVIIPKGIEHLPIAHEEAHVLLLEPKSTINTGEIISDKTKAELDWL